ncbi:MAG: hypothetical protein HY719_17840 [Planctomycetes bacterium]|nr:hypothetical protein [Planctomycetota bacterium]
MTLETAANILGLIFNIVGVILVSVLDKRIMRHDGNACGHSTTPGRMKAGWLLIIIGFCFQLGAQVAPLLR